MTGNEILQHRIKKARELAKSVSEPLHKIKSDIKRMQDKIEPSLTTSSNKDRAKKKRERQNRKKGRR